MKPIVHLFILLCLPVWASAQAKPAVQLFHLSDVRLLESPFERAQKHDKQYLLEMKADRLLAPFMREAGLPAKAPGYTSWEQDGLDGHIGGHYLSALSLMYASTGDEQIGQRLDYMLSELERCQNANGNGYIGGVPGGRAAWEEVAAGNLNVQIGELNGKWVPLYNIHKTYAGLRDAWLYAGRVQAREMLVGMTDWAIRLVQNLSDEQIQEILRSEHGGLNETFADVAVITGDPKYMELAQKFSHRWLLDPLTEKRDVLTGMHGNTQIPKVVGYKRVADLTGNDDWSEAARFFWNNVVEKRSVCIGGNSAREHYQPIDDFSVMIDSNEGPETCNTYNMLRLTKLFYEASGEKEYMEFFERALYNHILSTQHQERPGLVYFTPMCPGHYRVYSQPETSMWCCAGTGMENQAKYGEMIYAHADGELFVNLFIPSRLQWREKGTEIVQENRIPDEECTTLTVNPERKTDFTLHIRYPEWVADGELTVTVNGKKVAVERNADGYVSIGRHWKKGDRVAVELPMRVRAEQMPDKSNFYAFCYGPVVLAAKTGVEDMPMLYADDSRWGHVANGHKIPLEELPLLVSDPDRLAGCLSKAGDESLAFRISNLYPAGKWDHLELIPFFRVHDSRYIIYWPQAVQDNRAAALQKE